MFVFQKILEMTSTTVLSATQPVMTSHISVPDFYRDWLIKTGGGVYAFGGALRFFGLGEGALPSIDQWNAPDGWKSQYDFVSLPSTFFAEDAFGVQFFFDEESLVQRFTPETGEVDQIDLPISEFIDAVIDDPEETIGAEFFSVCESAIGDLSPREHFAFKVELALGGKYVVENVQKMPAERHMLALSKIAKQIYLLPEGTHIRPEQEG